MLRLLLALGALSATALPAAALAQDDSPYDQGRAAAPGYSGWGDNSYRHDGGDQDNDADDDYGQAPSADAYGRDSGYQGADPGYRDARGDLRGGDHFTGRVGASWRDGAGRYCRWREVAHRDADGYDAYKWVTLCRD